MRVLLLGFDDIIQAQLDNLLTELDLQVIKPIDDGIATVLNMQPELIFCKSNMLNLTQLSQAKTPEYCPAIVVCDEQAACHFSLFQHGVADFLTLPIDKEKLQSSLKKITTVNAAQAFFINQKHSTKKNRDHIAARTHRGTELIALEDVYYFSADQKYVKVRHKEGVVLIDETLKELEQEFLGRMFRIHRNALINLAYLDLLESVEGGQYRVKFRGIDDGLYVSRRHLPALRDKIYSI